MDAATAVDAEVRLYDNLFSDPDPDAPGKNFLDCLNPNSLDHCGRAPRWKPLWPHAQPGDHFQFMRLGYFCADKDSTPEHLVFNRSVSLKDGFKAKK